MPSKMEEFGFFLTQTFATTKNTKDSWPYIPGKYFVHDVTAPVAVTTLGSVALAKDVSQANPEGLCIVGKVETENIGIEKIIKNILANPAIQYLICAGAEPPKHLTGKTFECLFENGIDDKKRIIGSPGMRPALPNTSAEEVEQFCKQVTPVMMIDCTDVETICAKVKEIAAQAAPSNAKPLPRSQASHENIVPSDDVDCVIAAHHDPHRIKLDMKGYFVINLLEDRLQVEHYDYKERFVRVIEGDNARDIYLTIVDNDWVSKLDHAAYLGKELARAEYAFKNGLEFTQDGA